MANDKRKERKAVLENALSMGYWDYAIISSALEMARDYLKENKPDGAMCDYTYCDELRAKIAALQLAVVDYYK